RAQACIIRQLCWLVSMSDYALRADPTYGLLRRTPLSWLAGHLSLRYLRNPATMLAAGDVGLRACALIRPTAHTPGTLKCAACRPFEVLFACAPAGTA
ncbi:hypothetical protein, partial [Janthinobacterium sp. AD80]|uniref:hypothetical protein n=1 Tax=Janthinobacterium sp. AD80 TaxID=1528773 RepID=UPI001CA4F7F2